MPLLVWDFMDSCLQFFSDRIEEPEKKHSDPVIWAKIVNAWSGQTKVFQ